VALVHHLKAFIKMTASLHCLLVVNRVDRFSPDLNVHLSEKCVCRGLLNLFEIGKHSLKERIWTLKVFKQVIIFIVKMGQN
jgi:hypothetical protein